MNAPRHKNRPKIMAILNVTPDSFSDGGAFNNVNAAVTQAKRCVDDGADIIDIGAESTRPGATPVSAEQELVRVMPVLQALQNNIAVPISIDTYKADVARAAIENGASIINDVWGLQRDRDMADVAAETGSEVIIMHNRFEGADETINILEDMDRWFDASLNLATKSGVLHEKITLDPGIGFGKTFKQNLIVLAHLQHLKNRGYPILMGLSRKRFIGAILDVEADQRLYGTLAANLSSIMDGADIIRVHDVQPHREAIDIWMAIDAERT